MSTKQVDVRQKILAANEAAARKLRSLFQASETLVTNLISSPGAGKTTLLEATVPRLAPLKLAVLEGDIATERDADRIRKLGIPAHQILTGGACHLDARQVEKELDRARFSSLDLLFVENVGNLICPTSYDLGEDFKVALLSVTEGEDKPFKYPAIFARAAVTVITKIDLMPHVEFDLDLVRREIQTLNPQGRVFETSARSGEGIDEWSDFLKESVKGKR